MRVASKVGDLSSKFAHTVIELFAIRDGRTDIGLQTHRQTLIAPFLTGTGGGGSQQEIQLAQKGRATLRVISKLC